jgi:hypothetical protein
MSYIHIHNGTLIDGRGGAPTAVLKDIRKP